jgi:hypothetical protein
MNSKEVQDQAGKGLPCSRTNGGLLRNSLGEHDNRLSSCHIDNRLSMLAIERRSTLWPSQNSDEAAGDEGERSGLLNGLRRCDGRSLGRGSGRDRSASWPPHRSRAQRGRGPRRLRHGTRSCLVRGPTSGATSVSSRQRSRPERARAAIAPASASRRSCESRLRGRVAVRILRVETHSFGRSGTYFLA